MYRSSYYEKETAVIYHEPGVHYELCEEISASSISSICKVLPNDIKCVCRSCVLLLFSRFVHGIFTSVFRTPIMKNKSKCVSLSVFSFVLSNRGFIYARDDHRAKSNI